MRTLTAMALIGSILSWSDQAFAQLTIEQAKRGADFVVEAATQCSDHRKDPAILARVRKEWQQHLVDAGASASEADNLIDQSIASARSDRDTDEMALTMDCQMAGVKIPEQP